MTSSRTQKTRQNKGRDGPNNDDKGYEKAETNKR